MHLTTGNSPLTLHDQVVFREYHALLAYKLERRDELDRQIEQLALLPNLAAMVERLQCVQLVGVADNEVQRTSPRNWRASLEENLRLADVDAGDRGWLTPTE